MAKVYALSERDYKQLQDVIRWVNRNKHPRNTVRRRSVLTGSSGGGAIRAAVVASNPTATNNVLINLYSGGVEQTEGDEFEVPCYAIIASGSRLDMATPRLSLGQPCFVHYGNFFGDGERWYFVNIFNGAENRN